jgi:hypothetical protein
MLTDKSKKKVSGWSFLKPADNILVLKGRCDVSTNFTCCIGGLSLLHMVTVGGF